mgnify:FL=1
MDKAKTTLEKQFEYVKEYNKFFRCYTLEDFLNAKKIKNIQLCEKPVL